MVKSLKPHRLKIYVALFYFASYLTWIIMDFCLYYSIGFEILPYDTFKGADTVVLFALLAITALRSFSPPKTSIPIEKIRLEGSYLLIKKPNCNKLSDILYSALSFKPAASVAVLSDSFLYKFSKSRKSQYVKLKISKKELSYKTNWYAYELTFASCKLQKLLDKKIGTVYKKLRSNCAQVPSEVWELMGLKKRPFDFIPGILLWRLTR